MYHYATRVLVLWLFQMFVLNKYDDGVVVLQIRLAGVFEELGSASLGPLSLSVLLSHPVLQDVISACTTYKAVVSCADTHYSILILCQILVPVLKYFQHLNTYNNSCR